MFTYYNYHGQIKKETIIKQYTQTSEMYIRNATITK